LNAYCLDENGEVLLPVDPVVIALQLEAQVYSMELPQGVSGALVKGPNQPIVIMLNQDNASVRQRFTCAHELGHLAHLMKSGADQDEFTYVDFRDAKSSLGTDEEEIFANNFAAELLMPAKSVRKHVRAKNVSLPKLSALFGVSTIAMGHRLDKLKLAVTP
jgi:Zn-dependent peptidase ImmA (M78 family)